MDTEEDMPRPDELRDGTLAAVKLAYTSALAAYANGEVPDLPALLEQMREQASQPTQTETNTANIDYLLMTVGGDQ